MTVSPLAGLPAPASILADPAAIERAYYERRPDPADPAQRVTFGTSGHRGSPLSTSFNEWHVAAITQAICEYRASVGTGGPLFMGMDTHAVSAAAQRTALEVLAGNWIDTCVEQDGAYTPTPVISRAILVHNRARGAAVADGIVVTPSHNPPEDGGIKYNPPGGGPADAGVTLWIEARANALLRDGNKGVKRVPFLVAWNAETTHREDFIDPYVDDLRNVLDMEAVRGAGLRLGVDPLGGASVRYWERINAVYGLGIEIVNPIVDPTFAFMTVDHDGRIRMDCSSACAMQRLVALKDRFRVSFGNDPDADRHGIVTPSTGLMNPNRYLAVAIDYLVRHRPSWNEASAVGKTLVSSNLIDRVVARLGRRLYEVPVGFKWFAPGLLDGSICFGGEESAGASCLRRDGSAWTTDKDGMVLALLAAEMTARTGRDPGEQAAMLAAEFGPFEYTRVDAPATPEDKLRLGRLSAGSVTAESLAGRPITAKLTHAPGNGAPIGGLKVTTDGGWFAARPSGTESIYKIYAESFRDQAHLQSLVAGAQQIVADALRRDAPAPR